KRTAKNVRALAGRRAETPGGKYLGHVHTAARTDILPAGEQGPAAVPESDKAFPFPQSDRAPTAEVRAYTDCQDVRKAPPLAPARIPCRHTSRCCDRSCPQPRPGRE